MSQPVSTTIAHSPASLSRNRELASLFSRMAGYYRYLGPEQRFRANAYEQASRTLSLMREPIESYGNDMAKLDELKGVGKHIAEKIVEYLQTGHVRTFDELRKQVPYKLLALMDVAGIGPATLRLLHEKLRVDTPDELAGAIRKGRLNDLKGFGKRKIENLKNVLKIKSSDERMPLAEAGQLAAQCVHFLEKLPGVRSVHVAGSIRRKTATIGDIDLVLVTDARFNKRIATRFQQWDEVNRVLASGNTKISVLLKSSGRQVDIRLVHDYELGSALFYFTGNKEHNIRIRTLARERGWKINEYGLFNIATGKRLAGDTEKSIYDALGFRFIPPEERLGGEELTKYRLSK